jgi:hypothetical protein
MKQLLFVLALAIVTPTLLTGCNKPPSPQEAQKKKQQDEEDKKAMGGKFKKSDGKSY